MQGLEERLERDGYLSTLGASAEERTIAEEQAHADSHPTTVQKERVYRFDSRTGRV